MKRTWLDREVTARALWVFCAVSALSWMASVLLTPGLSFPADPGFDFFDYFGRFGSVHTGRFFSMPGYPWYYPAPAVFISYPFYRLAGRVGAVRAYDVFMATGALLYLVGALWFVKARRAFLKGGALLAVALVLAACYPEMFAMQRGNIEGLTWVLIAAGVAGLTCRRPYLAAYCFGIAGSIKLYPLLFLLLFFERGGARYIAHAVLAFVAVSVAGLLFLDPHLVESARLVSHGVHQWTVDVALARVGRRYDHSILGAAVKNFTPQDPLDERWLHLYYPVAGLVFAVAYFLAVKGRDFYRQVVFASVLAVVLSPTSFDYTLCLMYVPFALTVTQPLLPRRRTLLCLAYAVVLAPVLWMDRVAGPGGPGTLKCLALLSVLTLSLLRGDVTTGEEAPVQDLRVRAAGSW